MREFGIPSYLKTAKTARQSDDFLTPHFGVLLAKDLFTSLFDGDSIGMALRDARNNYLPTDAESTFLWTPPLMTTTGSLLLDQALLKDRASTALKSGEPMLDHKYTAYYEYALYGDPAFNPYIP